MKSAGRIGMVHDGAWDDAGYRYMALGTCTCMQVVED
jgi:hypothetical protein